MALHLCIVIQLKDDLNKMKTLQHYISPLSSSSDRLSALLEGERDWHLWDVNMT